MTLLEALNVSVENMKDRLEEHARLLVAANEGSGAKFKSCLVECPHSRKLRETLAEAIRVLEETRKAFKSKQLEALRKKLIGVLAETA